MHDHAAISDSIPKVERDEWKIGDEWSAHKKKLNNKIVGSDSVIPFYVECWWVICESFKMFLLLWQNCCEINLIESKMHDNCITNIFYYELCWVCHSQIETFNMHNVTFFNQLSICISNLIFTVAIFVLFSNLIGNESFLLKYNESMTLIMTIYVTMEESFLKLRCQLNVHLIDVIFDNCKCQIKIKEIMFRLAP